MTRAAGSAGDPPAPGDGRGWSSRGYLPHLDRPGLVQMVTFRLADSLPKGVATPGAALATDPRARARIEQLLDAGHGSCALRDERVAAVVESTLHRFDGERYRLIAWTIMPNHVHALIETLPHRPLSAIVHAWKSYTSKAANGILNNPVNAGLVSRAVDWRYGSAAASGPTPGAGGSPALPGATPDSPLPRFATGPIL
jgi:hypothetical protein